MLTDLISRDRVIVISPFTNFNVILGLNIAYTLMCSNCREISIIISYSVSLSVIREVIKNDKGVLFTREFKCLDNLCACVVVSNSIEAEKLLYCFRKTSKVFVLVNRVHQLHKLRNSAWNTYRVRRVDPNTYSLVSTDGDAPIILGVKGYSIHQTAIPEDALLIYREVTNYVKEFGTIRASDLVRYMVKILGYDRDFVLNAVRKSIAIGIIRYQSGYLIPASSISI
ncbi:MAG: hypothetical protein N3D82_01885 [Ignisphaera sp.]|nr:hypothetical protein [Ignisphaera sp.]MCX8167770.1 hypothetical protein [Ignisphaera sp.]MDW8085243.1 hypothetical protein [Ignisphaera sp.]